MSIPDHYVLDPLTGSQRLTPVGFWNITRSTSLAVYRLSGKKPNWLQKLMVYLATGWTWTDAKSYRD